MGSVLTVCRVIRVRSVRALEDRVKQSRDIQSRGEREPTHWS